MPEPSRARVESRWNGNRPSTNLMGTSNVWTADKGISARPRPQTVIGHAEVVSRGLPRLPTMSDAKSSYIRQMNLNAMQVKRASYFQQRCPYDTIPHHIPGSNARGGMSSLQHAQVEPPGDTWPITIPMSTDPSKASLGDNMTKSSSCSGENDSTRRFAYPSTDWTVRMDRSGRQYYVNKIDKRIMWTFPHEEHEKDVNGNSDIATSPTARAKSSMQIEIEDRILQRYSSDMLAVGEGSKKDVPDPLRDALLNKRVRREERSVMLSNAAGDSMMALVEGGRDSNLSGAAPTGAAQPGIHQSISRGMSGPTRVLRNLSKANILQQRHGMQHVANKTYSQIQHGGVVEKEEDVQVAVFDSRPNTSFSNSFSNSSNPGHQTRGGAFFERSRSLSTVRQSGDEFALGLVTSKHSDVCLRSGSLPPTLAEKLLMEREPCGEEELRAGPPGTVRYGQQTRPFGKARSPSQRSRSPSPTNGGTRRRYLDLESNCSRASRPATTYANDTLGMTAQGRLPTFDHLAQKTHPAQDSLHDFNAKAIVLNYPSVDMAKSQKGILAPVLTRQELPDPHFVKNRAGKFLRFSPGGQFIQSESGDTSGRESSEPITSLTKFGIVNPDGTIWPSNPAKPTVDDDGRYEELQASAPHQTLSSQSAFQNSQLEAHKLEFGNWVQKISEELKHVPARVAKHRIESVALTKHQHALAPSFDTLEFPKTPLTWQQQIGVLHKLHVGGKINSQLFHGLKQVILKDDPKPAYTFAADIQKDGIDSSIIRTNCRDRPIPIGPKTVRRKGGAWPDDGPKVFRDSSSPDDRPFAEFSGVAAKKGWSANTLYTLSKDEVQLQSSLTDGKTVRRKGGVWPEDGPRIFRDTSSPDQRPFGEFRCLSAEEEYNTTLQTFNSTVSGSDTRAMRDLQPAGRTTPGGYAGGEAFGNISESVQNIEEALTRRTTYKLQNKFALRV